MGFLSSIREFFAPQKTDDEELARLRSKHGIKIEDPGTIKKKEAKEMAEAYDPWEEVRHVRSNFFMGSWVSHKIGIIGEDKVKKQLADLEKKREAER